MWQVISIFLQAAGVLLLLWPLVGWLVLGRDRGGMAVFTCLPGQLGSVEPFLRCCMWLRGTGMLRMPVLLVDCGLTDEGRRAAALLSDMNTKLLTPQELAAYYTEENTAEQGG